MNALQHLIKEGYNDADINAMKSKLEYEGWKYDKYLPQGWMFKVVSEGFTKDNKWWSTIFYFSKEGEIFESMKNVFEHMETLEEYTDQDKENCKTFLESQKSPDRKYEWQEGDESLPPSWKMRISEGDAEMEWILSPDNVQYRSRVIALQDMIKREVPYFQVEEMRRKLIHEGWVTDRHFPDGWLIKKWEGKKRSKTGKLNQDLKFLTREGDRLESFKLVYEHMESHGYDRESILKVKTFKDQWSISVRRGGFEWEDGGETLPAGWQKRRGQGKTESEHILSPDGTQFRSRYNALMHMYKDGASPKLIKEMRSKLMFEGWESSPLLPSNWLFKRTWEGVISNGSFSTNTIYLSSEGKVFESNKTAIDWMMVNKSSYKQDNIEKIKEFQVCSKFDSSKHFVLKIFYFRQICAKRQPREEMIGMKMKLFLWVGKLELPLAALIGNIS